MRLARITLVLTATAVLALIVGPSAFGSHVSCGQTLTQDTTLDADLNCSGDGLQIGGNGVDLDLNGYTIRGGRSGSGIRGFQGFGPSDLTVHGGTIRNFEFAIRLTRAANSRISNLVIDGTDGLTLNGPEVLFSDQPTNVAFEDNEVIGAAITFEEGQWQTGEEFRPANNRIERNFVRGTGFFNGQLSLRMLDRNVVKDNTVSGGLITVFGDIRTNQGADENLIEGNRVTGSPQSYGILLAQDCVRNHVTGNEVSGGFHGILVTVDCADNVIERNQVYGIARNGIMLADPPYRTARNTVRDNTVHGAGLDGIIVNTSATESTVESNVVFENGEDGIDIDNAATTVTGAPISTAAPAASRLDSTRAIVTASPRRRKTCATATATTRRGTTGTSRATAATTAATEPGKTTRRRIARAS